MQYYRDREDTRGTNRKDVGLTPPRYCIVDCVRGSIGNDLSAKGSARHFHCHRGRSYDSIISEILCKLPRNKRRITCYVTDATNNIDNWLVFRLKSITIVRDG